MDITPDTQVIFEIGGIAINATIFWTWVVMAILVGLSILATRRLSDDVIPSRWQNFLEIVVTMIQAQIREVSQRDPGHYLSFVGTLFLFIAMANLLAIVPGYVPPTGSLSTTVALAFCVLVAVPAYGIASRGIGDYLKNYIRPTPFMLPFNIIGEVSRTIALAIRLYGNVMSGTIVVGILISIAPFFFPVLLELLGLLTGMVQAYIFAILAMVYIASAIRVQNNGGDAETAGGEVSR